MSVSNINRKDKRETTYVRLRIALIKTSRHHLDTRNGIADCLRSFEISFTAFKLGNEKNLNRKRKL